MPRFKSYVQYHPKQVIGVLLALFLLFAALTVWAWCLPDQRKVAFASLRGEVLNLQSPSVYPLDTLPTPALDAAPTITIPRIVHRVVLNDEVNKIKLPKLTHFDSWQHIDYTSAQQHEFVTNTFGKKWPDILHAYNLCRLTELQLSLFKYLVVYHNGGLYVDANALSNKSCDAMLSSDKAFVAPCTPPTYVDLYGDMTQRQGEYQSWWVMAPPKSGFLWRVIWQVVRNIFGLHTQGQHKCKFTQLSQNVADSTAGSICYTYMACKLKDYVTVCKNDFLALRHDITTQLANTFTGAPSQHLGNLPVHLVHVQNQKPKTPCLSKHKIPAIIHQTHETRWVTPAMAKAMQSLRDHAPYCEYRFYDDNERRCFVATHYPNALDAYDALIPGCYRADLFRAVVVYTLGGVYFDSGFSPLEGTDLFNNVIAETDEFVFPIDEWIQGLLTGFFAATPHHPYLKKIIDHIVGNIESRKTFVNHTGGFLKITGPKAYADALQGYLPSPLTEGTHHPNVHLLFFPVGTGVYKKGTLIYKTQYSGYYNDQKVINRGVPHYKKLWSRNQIYKTSVIKDLQRLRTLSTTRWPSHIPILYINLDRSKQRNEVVQKELQDVSDNITRVSAIDGKELGKHETIVSEFASLTPCELGCTASHLKAIKLAFDMNVEKAIICEDDVCFAPMRVWAQSQVNEFVESVTNSVGLVLLTWGGLKFDSVLTVQPVITTKGLYGTVAYMITRQGMVDVLNHSEVSNTHIHLKRSKSVVRGQADGYIFSLTKLATSNAPLALPLNLVHTSTIDDRTGFDHDSLHLELLVDIVNHVNNIHKTNPNVKLTNGLQTLPTFIHHVTPSTLSRNVYCVWAGNDDMSPNRKRCLAQFKTVCGCNVIVVNLSNLQEYIVEEQPLHPAFAYLSLTHKADYLRTYIMHFHGGGYSDIKQTTDSWVHAFERLDADCNKWVCGYPEVSHGVAYDPVKSKWQELVGNCAYICKPKTPFTTEWYNAMVALLDERLERLKLYPATHPQEQGESSIGHKGYPIEWNEMLGRIFHRLNNKYKDHILNVLPMSIFVNYR